jgi:hypothetical protein
MYDSIANIFCCKILLKETEQSESSSTNLNGVIPVEEGMCSALGPKPNTTEPCPKGKPTVCPFGSGFDVGEWSKVREKKKRENKDST